MFPKIMVPPKWMVKIMKNPIKKDDLGGKSPIFGSTPRCQLMVNCWFGSRWFGFLESMKEDWATLGVPLDSNPKPTHKPTIKNH